VRRAASPDSAALGRRFWPCRAPLSLWRYPLRTGRRGAPVDRGRGPMLNRTAALRRRPL
jgi:hypothetical protein